MGRCCTFRRRQCTATLYSGQGQPEKQCNIWGGKRGTFVHVEQRTTRQWHRQFVLVTLNLPANITLNRIFEQISIYSIPWSLTLSIETTLSPLSQTLSSRCPRSLPEIREIQDIKLRDTHFSLHVYSFFFHPPIPSFTTYSSSTLATSTTTLFPSIPVSLSTDSQHVALARRVTTGANRLLPR